MFAFAKSNVRLIGVSAAAAALFAFAAISAGDSITAIAAGGPSDTLVLKRVMLSSGGVGYFEYEARVEGDGVLTLPVRLDQVDDVLKSVVVFDNQGGSGTIQLPSRAPLSDIFRGLPFGPEALESGPGLIAALRGSEISVTGREHIDGRVISVNEETSKGADDLEITRHRVSVITDQGLKQFILEDAESVTFKDLNLQGQISAALASLAEHREGQSRVLTIRSQGSQSRIVTVAYVVGAPLWKSSYRITTADGQGKAWLQGWAALENVSGVDWKDVELTISTGNPVTFRQALYQTYYVDRPEIPVEVLGRILPKADEGSVSVEEKVASPYRAKAAMAPPPPPMLAAPSPVPMFERGMSGSGIAAAESADGVAGGAPDFDDLTKGRIAVQSKEAATQVTFKLPGAISVMNGQSLSVPIVNTQVNAERVALFQPATDPRHPLAAVKLVNDTDVSLPAGVVTLYERDKSGAASFVGDARMNSIVKGETRLLSFALDQKVLVDVDRKMDKTISKMTIANGVMKAAQVDTEEAIYTIKGAPLEARSMVLEHPRRPGWTITTPDPKTVDMTDTAFRVPASVKAGENAKVTVETEWAREQETALTNLSADEFLVYSSNAKLTDAQRDAFAKMAELKSAIDTTDNKLTEERAARERVFEEQGRIRENIKAVPEKSDLQNRYLRSMSELEDQAEARKKAIDTLDRTRTLQTDALNAFIGTLNF
jgi:hypothetical protein